ncbi:hypothetical protein RQP46_000336 [Phenoliferia psychrophenolica]
MSCPKRADAKNPYAETDVDMASDSDSPAPVIKPKAGAPSKKARVEESASDVESRAEEDDFEPTTTKKKATKSKSAKSKTSTKVGKLQAFQAVPFDVFAEICQHLNSKDLINLSLSSKNIRANLVGQAAVPLWRNARRSVGLPDLEAGVMTEVQYAYLFVVMKCQCDVFLLTRLCMDCRKKMWTSNLRSGGLHPLTHVCVPTTLPFATKTDVEFISNKLHDLESQDKEIAKALASKSKSKSKAPEASPPTPLLDAYVDARKLLLVKMKADGETLSKAAGNLQLNQACPIPRTSDELVEWLSPLYAKYGDLIRSGLLASVSNEVARYFTIAPHNRAGPAAPPRGDVELARVWHALLKTIIPYLAKHVLQWDFLQIDPLPLLFQTIEARTTVRWRDPFPTDESKRVHIDAELSKLKQLLEKKKPLSKALPAPRRSLKTHEIASAVAVAKSLKATSTPNLSLKNLIDITTVYLASALQVESADEDTIAALRYLVIAGAAARFAAIMGQSESLVMEYAGARVVRTREGIRGSGKGEVAPEMPEEARVAVEKVVSGMEDIMPWGGGGAKEVIL